jgi:hypothetical protein
MCSHIEFLQKKLLINLSGSECSKKNSIRHERIILMSTFSSPIDERESLSTNCTLTRTSFQLAHLKAPV